MRTYIQKLQSKPEHIRKQVLIAALSVSMFVVATVWIYGLGYRFDGDTQVQAQNDIKPFQLFSESIGETFNNIGASVGNISPDENQANVVPVEPVPN